MRPDTIQEELFKLFANLGGDVTALNSNSYTSQAWLHKINELVASGGVEAIKVSPTAPVNPAAGNLWYNPNTGICGFWNGTYWLSENVHGINFAITTVWGSAGTRTAGSIRTIHPAYTGLFFENYSVLHLSGAGWDASNYSTFEVIVTTISGHLLSMGTFTVNNVSNSSSQWREFSLNYARTLTRSGLTGGTVGFSGVRDVQVVTTKVGTAATVVAMEYITYRGILS